MNWQLTVDSGARKYLKKIPRKDAERLFYTLQEMAVNPYGGDIEKMHGEKKLYPEQNQP